MLQKWCVSLCHPLTGRTSGEYEFKPSVVWEQWGRQTSGKSPAAVKTSRKPNGSWGMNIWPRWRWADNHLMILAGASGGAGACQAAKKNKKNERRCGKAPVGATLPCACILNNLSRIIKMEMQFGLNAAILYSPANRISHSRNVTGRLSGWRRALTWPLHPLQGGALLISLLVRVFVKRASKTRGRRPPPRCEPHLECVSRPRLRVGRERRGLREGLRLTMTMPPDCSTVHMLMMGAMPMVVPWK